MNQSLTIIINRKVIQGKSWEMGGYFEPVVYQVLDRFLAMLDGFLVNFWQILNCRLLGITPIDRVNYQINECILTD